jgi:Tetratricopeptide repeat
VQGQFGQAEPLLKRALGINEKVLGPNNPAVAESLNELVLLYHDQGRLAQAELLSTYQARYVYSGRSSDQNILMLL